MSSRSDFSTIKSLWSAKNGGNNLGVFLVKSRKTGGKFIEKQVRVSFIKAGHAAREVAAMRQCLNHPNIIKLEFWCLDTRPGYGSIVMQRCELGSLDLMIYQFSKRSEVLKDEGFVFKLFWDVALALCYLSTGLDVRTTRKRAQMGQTASKVDDWNRICHRDLKPGNLFLTWKDSLGADKCVYPTVVLGEFGCNVSTADVLAGRADSEFWSGGTLSFAPPESPRYHGTSDVYMLGLTIHCLTVMRNTPMDSQTELFVNPLQGAFKCNDLATLTGMCLHLDPRKRVVQNDLPMFVWHAYSEWRKARSDDGRKLPSWALQ